MAREEQDREDLLREATALVERVELQLESNAEPVVIGFRRDGCASFFFGVSPVWQFNTRNELRRAYFEGRLLKAEKGNLIALHRERLDEEVVLVREELSAEQERKILTLADRMLSDLLTELNAGRYTIVGQVSAEGEVLPRITKWLKSLASPLRVAVVPNAR